MKTLRDYFLAFLIGLVIFTCGILIGTTIHYEWPNTYYIEANPNGVYIVDELGKQQLYLDDPQDQDYMDSILETQPGWPTVPMAIKAYYKIAP